MTSPSVMVPAPAASVLCRNATGVPSRFLKAIRIRMSSGKEHVQFRLTLISLRGVRPWEYAGESAYFFDTPS